MQKSGQVLNGSREFIFCVSLLLSSIQADFCNQDMVILATITLSWRMFKHWYLTIPEQTPKLTVCYYAIIFLGFEQ